MRVGLGGTFNVFHIGHMRLLSLAVSIAGKGGEVLVGVSSDRLAAEMRRDRGVRLRPFEERKREVEIFLRRHIEEAGEGVDYEISEIDDPVMPAMQQCLDALVVSHETEKNGLRIKEAYRKRGRSLRLYVMGMVLAEDGFPVSSTRILRGEVDERGMIGRPVRVCVGSLSPPKIDGTRMAFKKVFDKADVRGVDISKSASYTSGASHPLSIAEMVRTARERAVRALREGQKKGSGVCDYGVGIEHGVLAEVAGMGGEGAGGAGVQPPSFHVCCVIDRGGLETWGNSPGFPIPGFVFERLTVFERLAGGSADFPEGHGGGRGVDMSTILEHYLNTRDIGKKGGVTSLLSEGMVERKDLVFWGVLSALIPRIRSDIYFLRVLD